MNNSTRLNSTSSVNSKGPQNLITEPEQTENLPKNETQLERKTLESTYFVRRNKRNPDVLERVKTALKKVKGEQVNKQITSDETGGQIGISTAMQVAKLLKIRKSKRNAKT